MTKRRVAIDRCHVKNPGCQRGLKVKDLIKIAVRSYYEIKKIDFSGSEEQFIELCQVILELG